MALIHQTLAAMLPVLDGRSTWRRGTATELMLGARSVMLLRDTAA